MSESAPSVRMPENAYRELQPGEVYAPIVPARASVPEVTVRSVAFGLAMVVMMLYRPAGLLPSAVRKRELAKDE